MPTEAQPSKIDPQHLVLVADDEETIRHFTAQVIARMDLTPVVVANGDAAVAVVAEHGPAVCCAILDIHMPIRDGIEAARAIRAIAPELPIILMTGLVTEGYVPRLAQLGSPPLLQKPFSLKELREHILHATQGSPAGVPDDR